MCKKRAKRLQNDCKKRERPKTASPFPSVILKTKTFHLIQGKASSAFPNHEEHSTPFIITDF